MLLEGLAFGLAQESRESPRSLQSMSSQSHTGDFAGRESVVCQQERYRMIPATGRALILIYVLKQGLDLIRRECFWHILVPVNFTRGTEDAKSSGSSRYAPRWPLCGGWAIRSTGQTEQAPTNTTPFRSPASPADP